MLTQRLTGQFTTDHTMAGTSMMTNLTSGNWDPSILASLGLSNNHFPCVMQVKSWKITYTVSPEMGIKSRTCHFLWT